MAASFAKLPELDAPSHTTHVSPDHAPQNLLIALSELLAGCFTVPRVLGAVAARTCAGRLSYHAAWLGLRNFCSTANLPNGSGP